MKPLQEWGSWFPDLESLIQIVAHVKVFCFNEASSACLPPPPPFFSARSPHSRPGLRFLLPQHAAQSPAAGPGRHPVGGRLPVAPQIRLRRLLPAHRRHRGRRVSGEDSVMLLAVTKAPPRASREPGSYI